jgi:hypothetical protein
MDIKELANKIGAEKYGQFKFANPDEYITYFACRLYEDSECTLVNGCIVSWTPNDTDIELAAKDFEQYKRLGSLAQVNNVIEISNVSNLDLDEKYILGTICKFMQDLNDDAELPL